MAKNSIGKIFEADIRTSLDTKIARAFQAKILSVLNKILISCTVRVRNHLKQEFKENPIIQSLLGKIESGDGLTLKGEFGLTTSMATEATNKLIDAIADKAKVIEAKNTVLKNPVSSTVRNILFFLSVNYPNTTDVIKSLNFAQEPFAYESISKKKKRKSKKPKKKVKKVSNEDRENPSIYWLTWLMYPMQNLFQEQLFDFDIDDFGIMRKRSSYSRSGQALMTKNVKKSVRFPYALPKFILPKSAGDSFIDDYFALKKNQEAIKEIVKREFKYRVKGLR